MKINFRNKKSPDTIFGRVDLILTSSKLKIKLNLEARFLLTVKHEHFVKPNTEKTFEHLSIWGVQHGFGGIWICNIGTSKNLVFFYLQILTLTRWTFFRVKLIFECEFEIS